MNWMTGFTTGLMVGMSVMGFAAAQGRRQQQQLERLLQRGQYRILKADGSPTSAGELFAALGAAPARLSGKGALVIMGVMALAAALGAFLALRGR